MKKLKEYWVAMPIGIKIRTCLLFLLLAVAITSGFNIYVIRFSVGDINGILNDIACCEKAQDAITEEEKAFRAYVRSPSDENDAHLKDAVVRSRGTINLLPYDFQVIGEERFAGTWRLLNAYRSYSDRRDAVWLKLSENSAAKAGQIDLLEDQDTVEQIYQVYDMQRYIGEYLQNISLLTVDNASDIYNLKYPMLQSIPYIQVGISILLVMTSFGFLGLLAGSIVTPLQELAEASRNISSGKLDGEDVHVVNKDEVGELVDSFNHMKHVTRNNIQTLEENQRLAEQLHKEAVERAQTEKRLAAVRMDLLQSQIRPHFLFNTLNTIAGMAELEDAEKTGSMILALARLFRYNLHTTDQFVSLSQELDVARDYLYLQRMRFGGRVEYELPRCENGIWDEEISDVRVPVFILQPLIENAVLHGISVKENGGKIMVSARKENGLLLLRVSDTGAGIDSVKLNGMMDKLKGMPGDVHVGVGLGNLYKRMTSLYGEDSMQVESVPDQGTSFELRIPLKGQESGAAG